METKPHGWATTRTGSMCHYFGLTREGSEGYHPHGSPMALCHQAVRAGSDTLATELGPDAEQCGSCAVYLKKALAQQRRASTPVAGKLGPGSSVKILRGKNIAGLTGTIKNASKDFPGFWYVTLGAGCVMLSEGQLELK
jgi:hypothetical protein